MVKLRGCLNGADRDKLDPILDVCVAVYKEQLDEDGQVDFKESRCAVGRKMLALVTTTSATCQRSCFRSESSGTHSAEHPLSYWTCRRIWRASGATDGSGFRDSVLWCGEQPTVAASSWCSTVNGVASECWRRAV